MPAHLFCKRFQPRERRAAVMLAALLGAWPWAAMAANDAPGTASARRPNIVFIFSDDHGWQAISAYGSYRNQTPQIDRLAQGGLRFDSCYVTNSICAPSRAVILTGKHSHVIGHTTNERLFDTSLPTFPRLLRDCGYQTALIGKWHLRTEPQGFDHYHVLINQGQYYNAPMIRNGARTAHTGYVTDVLTELAVEWLRDGRDPARPFLLMLHHKAPHTAWEPGPDHLTKYDDLVLPEPPTLFDDFDGRSSAHSYAEMSVAAHLHPGALHLVAPAWQLNAEQLALWNSVYEPKNAAFRAAKLHGKALTRWKYQRYAKDYLRCVASIDDGVGRVLDELDRLELADNTVVVYSSDQGWFLGEHGWFDKRWMYEESFRMPLLVRWPGVTKPGSVNRDLVQNLDFAPTFLALAGAAVPADMQGRSLVPLLRGTTPDDWRKSVYYHFYEDRGAHKVPRHCGVRTDRHKLIHFYGIDEWEMYDLACDPDELRSVYDDPFYADVRAELTAELARLRAHYGVTEHADREVDRFQDQQQARWAFAALLGRQPSRWGIDVETVRREALDGYHRERIAYEIGGRRIEAFVLIPDDGHELHPAVLALHPGRETADPRALGKSVVAGAGTTGAPAYGLDLCRRGYVVMCPDRLGFESRRTSAAAPPAAGAAVADGDGDHGIAAARQLLAEGATLAGVHLAEMMFAIDYLARRPEVHEKRIGVIGHGEGGLLAMILAHQFEDVACVVSSCGTVSFGEALARDAEPGRRALLTIPGILAWGDIDDIVAGIYPRPVLELSTDHDRNPHFDAARTRYGDEGRGERVRYDYRAQGRPVFDQVSAESAYAWFDQWLRP